MVAEAVKECLGIKDDKAKVEGGVVDSDNTTGGESPRDYSSFVD